MTLSTSKLPPGAELGRDGWRDYDAAWAQVTVDDAAARRLLEQTHVRFQAAGDAVAAACVAAAALILIAARHADFRGLGEWLQRFQSSAVPADRDERPLALRFHVAMLSRPTIDKSVAFDSPEVVASAAEAFRLLRSAIDLPADERLLHGKLLLDWLNLDKDRERFETVASLLTPAAADPSASPYWVGVWWWRLATTYGNFGECEAALACRERAWQIARGRGIDELHYALLAEDLNDHLKSVSLTAAGEAVARMRTLAPSVNAAWQGHGLLYAARYHLLRFEPQAAVQLCRRALELYAGSEVSDRERDVTRVTLAYGHVLQGEEGEALRIFEQCRVHVSGGQRKMLDAQEFAIRAWLALRTGTADFEDLLRQALATSAPIHAHNVLFFLPRQASALFDEALRRGIETDFVTRAIRLRRLAPPDPADERWPWMLRVRVLGGFAIERDGVDLGGARKAQKKPEELLKAVITAGGDADVEQIVLDLWPDEEAKDPRASFDMALTRLRKIIGVDGALVLADGRLALDGRVVWCDAQAFETLRLRLHGELAGMSAIETVVPLVERLAALHRGPLFGSGTAAPWMLAPRERLAMAWERAVQEAGAWLESRSEWRVAIALYERGVAQQMLAEPIYRGLMRCHLALGERAEALIVYRRCRDLLSRVLGVLPSAETNRIYERLVSDASERTNTR